MRKAEWAGLMLALLGGGVVDAAERSMCARLADEARQLPAAAWARPQPLGRWLQWLDWGARPERSAAEASVIDALAADPRWRERVGASVDGVIGVEPLAGTPVYLVEHMAGTANCQSAVLVEVHPGQPPRELPWPFKLGDMSLCTTQFIRVAQVFKHPALVVGGATTMTSDDYRYRITPWTGQGWGPSCSLDLHLRSAMKPGRRFCAPGAAVCEPGQSVARQLALAYEADRKSGLPLDERRFAAGRTPPDEVADALYPPLAEPGAVGHYKLPLFGAVGDPMDTQFSNADPRRLPVFIDGRWWLAVVGRGGVGWREGGVVLVALFQPPGRAEDAVAFYQFPVGPVGLRAAVARGAPR